MAIRMDTFLDSAKGVTLAHPYIRVDGVHIPHDGGVQVVLTAYGSKEAADVRASGYRLNNEVLDAEASDAVRHAQGDVIAETYRQLHKMEQFAGAIAV